MNIYTNFENVRLYNEKLDHSGILKAAYNHQFPNVFLSHSSADHEILPAIIQVLKSQGGQVYIDDSDPRLSGSVSPETARIIRMTIERCRRMVVLVTTNTKESKWIPWELGFGDGKNYHSRVVLFPVVQDRLVEDWPEQEYFGLYGKIVWSRLQGKTSNEWLIWHQHENTARSLREWFR